MYLDLDRSASRQLVIILFVTEGEGLKPKEGRDDDLHSFTTYVPTYVFMLGTFNILSQLYY